jgi:uncharacterized membrane protein YeaQ/YmgE (transglycosylase-associated protein family)
MHILALLGLGLAAGWLASWLAGRFTIESRYGMMGDLVAGVAGAVVGGLLVTRLLPATPSGINLPGVAVTLLGASLLIVAVRLLTGDAWKVWQKTPDGRLSDPLMQRLATERGVSAQDAGQLRMKQQRGEYAGRTVTYFQVFDPNAAAARSTDWSHPDTMDSRRFLHSGFIEEDGSIILNAPPRDPIVRVSAAAI